LKNYELFIYEDTNYITESLYKNVLKWLYPSPYSELRYFYTFFLIVVRSPYFYCTQCLEKHR